MAAGRLEGATDLEKLHNLCKKTHKEQAVWFLNAFWEDFMQVCDQNLFFLFSFFIFVFIFNFNFFFFLSKH